MSPEQFYAYLAETSVRFQSAPLDSAMRACLEPLLDGFADNFVRARDSDGQAWPLHAPATVKKYGPHPLLILSGRMIAAAIHEGAPGHITKVEARLLTTGIQGETIPYAGVHQYGRPEGNPPIPRREYLYASPETLDRCEKAFVADAEAILFP
jgi:hypothetical protein